MSRTVRLLAALVALVALLGACTPGEPEFSQDDQARAGDRGPDEDAEGGDGDGGAADETIPVTAVDIDYDSSEYSASAGTIGFELTNDGRIHHDIAVEELGDQIVVEADPGETNVGTVSLDAGSYTLFCTVPGHRAAGMEATLTVD